MKKTRRAQTLRPFLKRIYQTKPVRDFQEHFYISLRHRYAFHTIGKAANSTVKHIFYSQELAGTRFPMPSVHDRMASPLLSSYQLSDMDLRNVLYEQDFLRFTFVRNPFSRILSCYLDRIQDQKSRPYNELMNFMGKERGYAPSFPEFIEAICAQSVYQQNNHWRVQYYDAMANCFEYDFIGKQESFAEDISHLYRRIFNRPLEDGAVKTNASPSQTSASQKVLEYWTKDLQECFVEKYEADFEYFNYAPVLGT